VRVALNPPPEWLKVITAELRDDHPVLAALDNGEKAALILGMSLSADLILIDERKGAAAAKPTPRGDLRVNSKRAARDTEMAKENA